MLEASCVRDIVEVSLVYVHIHFILLESHLAINLPNNINIR